MSPNSSWQQRKGIRADRSSPTLPKNWPTDVAYLTKLIYSPKIPKDVVEKLQGSDSTPPGSDRSRTLFPTPSQLVQILPITTPSHPAYGQHGLFATRSLDPRSLIVVYLGFVHDESATDHSSDYDISLDRELGLAIDAKNMGNEARFINDYRGTGVKGPNAEFGDVWIAGKKAVGAYVRGGKRGGIRKGDEIVVSYGKSFWKQREKENAAENADKYLSI